MRAGLFILSGFLAVSIQTLLLREMLVVFQGNEVSLGIMLSQWLLAVAGGSFLAQHSNLLARWPARFRLGITFFLMSWLLIGELIFIRYLRVWLGTFPGEGLSLWIMLWSSMVIFFPISILFGVQFVWGVRWLEEEKNQYPSSRIYLWEALGYGLGGIIFTFVLISYLSTLAITGVLMVLGILAASITASRLSLKISGIVLALGLALLTVIFSPGMEKATLSHLYAPAQIEVVQNSPYGQHIVTRQGQEIGFFFNGSPLLTLPYLDQTQIEERVHLPLLFHPAPKNILLIGSAGAFLPALLQHPLQQLDYIEQDPWLIHLLQKDWPDQLPNPFQDPRLHVYIQDIRSWTKTSARLYDAVILGVDYPVTLAGNRFYTQDFFSKIQQILKPDGILTLALPGSLVHVPPSLNQLLSTLQFTLEKVFPQVLVLPGEQHIFIAKNSPGRFDLKQLRQRLVQSPVSYHYLSAAYLDYRLDPQKQVWWEKQIEHVNRTHFLNQDFQPKAMLAGLLYTWHSLQASSRLSAFYAFLVQYAWVVWLVLLAWFFFPPAGIAGTAFTSGSASMGLQMLSLWVLQVLSGALYQWVGLLSAAFMVGLAGGAFFLQRRLAQVDASFLLKSEGFFLGWILGWWLGLRILLTSWPMAFVFSTGSGFLLGMQFPALVSYQASTSHKSESQVAGALYAADVWGGWLAALFLGALFIPAYGMQTSLLLLLLLKGISCKYWFLSWVRNQSRA